MGRNLKAVFISHYMFRLRVLYPKWTLGDYISAAHSRWNTFRNNPNFIQILQELADEIPLKIGYTIEEQKVMRDIYENIRENECIITLDAVRWNCGILYITECQYVRFPSPKTSLDLVNQIKTVIW